MAATAVALCLSTGAAAAAADASPVTEVATPKDEGPIELSLAVAATGAIAGAGTVVIVRRHQRRSRGGRR
ncbi:hypothetical protein [Streptomyces sp. NPDC020681]|uniref:hypothetical protein n=1 Tax=Streptomyces sp. NPDC020681 TaxID=3365083 RepID=UPI0037ACBE8D